MCHKHDIKSNTSHSKHNVTYYIENKILFFNKLMAIIFLE